MSEQSTDLSDLALRVEKLERQNRRLKRAGAAALLGLTTLILMGQAATKSRTIEANGFILKDTHGRKRADLGIGAQDFPNLTFYTASGGVMASLYVAAAFDGGGVEGLRGEVMGLALNEQPTKDERGKSVAILPDRLVFEDRWKLPLREGMEIPVRILVQDADEGATIALHDSEGFTTTMGSAETVTPSTGEKHKASAASLLMFDKTGKVLWRAP